MVLAEESEDGLTVVNDSNQFHDDEDFGTFDFKRNKHVFSLQQPTETAATHSGLGKKSKKVQFRLLREAAEPYCCLFWPF